MGKIDSLGDCSAQKDFERKLLPETSKTEWPLLVMVVWASEPQGKSAFTSCVQCRRSAVLLGSKEAICGSAWYCRSEQGRDQARTEVRLYFRRITVSVHDQGVEKAPDMDHLSQPGGERGKIKD